MLKNIFLFTGEEKFLLHQELKRWIDGFVQKYGTESIFTFKTDNFNLEGLRQALYGGGLFVQKKMCIVYGFPIDSDSSNKLSSSITENLGEELIAKGENLDPELILIFISYKPDKRTRFYTFLKKSLAPSNLKEFEYLKPAEIKQFIRQYTANIQRKDHILDIFLTKTGTGLLHIVNELDKIKIWAENKNIKELAEKDIHMLTFAMTGADNFEIFDTMFVDQKRTLELVSRLQEEGTNRNAFLGTLYRGIKNRIFTLDCLDEGIDDSKIIASKIKAPPFTINKILKNKQIISAKKHNITKLYKGLIDLENDIKQGKKSDSYFWLEIKKLLIYHG